jgi:hypothetical protein
MEAGENVKALAGDVAIKCTLLYVWKQKVPGQPCGSEAGGRQAPTEHHPPSQAGAP